MKCPKCKHVFKAPQQKKAAKSRWAGLTKTQRVAEMKRVRAKGIKRKAKP